METLKDLEHHGRLVNWMLETRIHALDAAQPERVINDLAAEWVQVIFQAAAKLIGKPVESEWTKAEHRVAIRIAMTDCGFLMRDHSREQHVASTLAAIQTISDASQS